MTESIDFERAKYQRVWAEPWYRVKAHGLMLWEHYRDIFPEHVGSAVDLGCGTGRLFAQWNAEGIDGHGVDFAGNAVDENIMRDYGEKFHLECLWQMELHRKFDLGVCADVMEHIPEVHVADALKCIGRHCDVVVFKIANFPSYWRDDNLHPTQRPGDWWQAKLNEAGRVTELLSHSTAREEYLFRWRP